MRFQRRSYPFFSPALAAVMASGAFATQSPTVRAPIVPQPPQADVKTILVEPVKPASAPVEYVSTPLVEREAKTMTPTPHAKPRVARNRVIHSTSEGNVLWSRGDSYKASFDASGATCVPDFGSSAPRNFETKLALASVTVDGAPLSFSAAAPTRAADRIVYDRGTLREVYDLTPNTIEQSFVFDALPTRGAVEVRVNVESDLTPNVHDGHLSYGNDLGRFDVSNAIAIDANGARVELETSWNEEQWVLRVPAEFVRTARFPLVVDPTILFSTPAGGVELDYLPDVSYDAGSDRTAYTWERAFSGTDGDIVVQVVNSAGVVLHEDYVDVSTQNWRHPSIAYNRFAQNYLVAAEVGFSPSRSIQAGFVSADGLPSAPFVVSTGALGDQLLPDVGGDFYTGSVTGMCVVWERDSSTTDTDILARVFQPNGTPVTGIIFVANSVGTLDRHPSISKGTGEGANSFQGWNIAYDHQFAANDRDIWCAQITFDGVVVTPPFAANFSGSDDAYPSVTSCFTPAGAGDQYFVVAQRFISGNQRDLVATALTGNSGQGETNLSAFVPASVGESQIAASAETDGKQLFVAHMETYQGSSTDTDTYVSEYAFANGVLVPNGIPIPIGFSFQTEEWPQIASVRSSGGMGTCVRVVWEYGASGVSDIKAASLCGELGGPSTTFCAGDSAASGCPCSNFGVGGHGCANSVNPQGSELWSSGAASVAGDTLVLQASGMPNSASCLFFQATLAGTGAVFGDGKRCTAGTTIRLGTKTCVGGAASYPQGADVAIHTRGAIPTFGATRYYQVWYRNAATFCTSSTFNLSNGLSVVWVR